MSPLFDTVRSLGFRRGPRRLLAGIAGGIAARTGLNVWLVRLLLLIAFLLPFVGFAAYVVAWLLLPWQDDSIPLERLLTRG
ncbi:PspC domain-containing protein [Brachybacterium halotolerans subsp. kimchii]|uniref:PspC domain-containing protein n=1 Tax=Brachybacterium halotolerans TaxID=2795215 RepID=UPI001E4B70C5|nr:PspC domain-containing protein [Brachybacterium halotolerans]UEJ82413.1 PspC domain-containing protein [Brachybacterium halotolerans subsp. kimchii]